MDKLIEYLDDIRGWSLRQPVGEPIILLMSGGLDSSIVAEMCLDLLRVKLYPIYIKRGAHAEKQELHATKQVVHYLKNQYPNRVERLKIISAQVPPRVLSKMYDPHSVRNLGLPLRNAVLVAIAVQYALTLKVPVKSIVLCAEKILPEGAEYPDMSIRTLIANTIMIGSNLNDWEWQVVSPLLIPGLLPGRDYVTKAELVRWAESRNFPIYITYSCTKGGEVPCGACRSCIVRNKVLKNMEGLSK